MAEQRKPSKSPAPPRQHSIGLPRELSARLETIARSENNSVSSIVRRILTKALATSHGDEAA